MGDYDLYPGTMGPAGLCIDLLGIEHVIAGEWRDPVGLRNVSESDVESIVSLAAECDVKITVRKIPCI